MTIVFIVEMLIKLLGLGLQTYLKDRFNIFDAVIVLISTIDLVLLFALSSTTGALSALRGFRLLRVFKLAKSW